jgi:hypothetical protein
MSDIDEKILKVLEDLQAGQKALQTDVGGLKSDVKKQGTQLEAAQAGQKQQGHLLAGLEKFPMLRMFPDELVMEEAEAFGYFLCNSLRKTAKSMANAIRISADATSVLVINVLISFMIAPPFQA